MSRNVIKNTPFESFPNFTDEMYLGNEPCGKGHEMVSGGYADRWTTEFGGGETYKGEIQFFSINIDRKISLFICGDTLYILDIRHDGKTDFWEYSNNGNGLMPGSPCCSESSRHTLEPDHIEKIINTKRENSKIWDMVMRRARELYDAAELKKSA